MVVIGVMVSPFLAILSIDNFCFLKTEQTL